MPKRNYKRGGEFRDQKLFVIACEGSRREPEYFATLVGRNRRIRIELLHPPAHNPGGSDPQRVLGRAEDYTKRFRLDPQDQLWLVLDCDRWHPKHIRDLVRRCSQQAQWGIALSNPCFEVWLCMHFSKELLESADCKQLKNLLSTFLPQGYDVEQTVLRVGEAVSTARQFDDDVSNSYPKDLRSKVYILIEQLMPFLNFEKGD